jgi:hypothetical protein
MDLRKPVIERAIELARTGLYRDMQAAERQLDKESYEAARAYLTGALRGEIATICRNSFGARSKSGL